MGIRFFCPACGKKINVKSHQAGLRGFCPKCEARIEIPLQSLLPDPKEKDDDSDPPAAAPTYAAPTYAAPTYAAAQTPTTSSAPGGLPVGRLLAVLPGTQIDPLAEFPAHQWYVAPPGATQPFGPADAATIGVWLQQGHITAATLVWRQDWPEWKPAGQVWPQLAAAPLR